jgi:site-specific DNA-methyltransferase (adenine-specific)
MACAIEDAGFEIRDQIQWIYGSGFPKSHNIGKAVDKLQGNEREVVGKIAQPGSTNNRIAMGNGWQDDPDLTKGTSQYEGWGTALKPANEPICMARKPLSEKTVASNVLKYGTGGINIDECRVEYKSEKDANNAKNGGGQAGGWAFRSEIPQRPHSELGRFPANVIHDGSDEVVDLFPDSKGASSQNNNSNGHIYRGQSLEESETSLNGHRDWYNDNGSAARFFYCAKTSKSERNKGLEGFEDKQTWASQEKRESNSFDVFESDGREKTINKNNHPTVKPIKLMQYLCRLITPKGGTVLDPFNGSGSTGCACVLEGFNYIGIDLDQEYCKISEARIKAYEEENKQEKLYE